MFLESCLQNSQENTCVRDSILIKLQVLVCKKDTLAQVFSCEFNEISSKNNFFAEHLQTTASNLSFSEATTGGVLWKKVFLKISQNSQENTLWFPKFSRTQNISGRLLLAFPCNFTNMRHCQQCLENLI